MEVWVTMLRHRGCDCCSIPDSASVDSVHIAFEAAEARAREAEQEGLASWADVEGPFTVPV